MFTRFTRLCRINTLLVILAAIGLALAAVGALLVLADMLEPTEILPFRWFAGALADLDVLGGADKGWAYGGAALAVVLGAVFAIGNLWFLLRGHDAQAGSVWIQARPNGTIIVPRRTLEASMAQAASEVTGVTGATVSLHGGSNGMTNARATLRLDLPADRDAPQTINEAEARMTRVAREDFGIVISRIDIATTMAEPHWRHA